MISIAQVHWSIGVCSVASNALNTYFGVQFPCEQTLFRHALLAGSQFRQESPTLLYLSAMSTWSFKSECPFELPYNAPTEYLLHRYSKIAAQLRCEG